MNRKAIITGATRGIGREIATRLAGEGIDLSLVARNKDKVQELAEEFSRIGIRTLPIAMDLEDEEAPGEIMRQTVSEFGGIDILINNAGMPHKAPISEADSGLWNKMFAVNARAPYFLCQQAIPHLKQSDNPVIVNIGSVVDHKGYVNQSIYSATKHALAGFTKVLAKEVQEDHIRVHLISPGGVYTELVGEMRPDLKEEEMIQTTELADMVSFLVNYRGRGVIDEIRIRRFNSTPFD
jgi:3-oxoacyl-[acyl-carrier protein] reductase